MKMTVRTVKIFTFNALLIIGLLSCKTTSTAGGSPSIKNAEYQISQQNVDAALWFNTSAEMHYAAIQAYDFATLKLKESMEGIKSGDRPLAVIMDLDETVLDNSPYMLAEISNGRTFSSDTWLEWCAKADAKAIPGALNFITTCEEIGVEVFYISNRDIQSFEGTFENMTGLGINVVPEKIMLREAKSSKADRRDMVFANYNVLLLVGDNLKDFSDSYGQRTDNYGKNVVDDELSNLRNNFILIPNPMYGEWKKAIYKNQKNLTNEQKLKIVEDITKIETLSEDSRPDSD